MSYRNERKRESILRNEQAVAMSLLEKSGEGLATLLINPN